jgi:uncharacterized protein YndB with AHSA1/START domain
MPTPAQSARSATGGATASHPSLTIKRHIKATPAKVFAAWTDPQKLMLWMGPAAVSCLKAESDPRPGGSYRVELRGPDGEQHVVMGVYREVAVNERLVFTWFWHTMPERQSLVTVTFRPDGDGTMMSLLHEQFFDDAARDRHAHGWAGSLDKLDRMFV